MRTPQSPLEPPSNAYGFVNRRSWVQFPPPAQESQEKRIVEKFWTKVQVDNSTPEACWNWSGAKDHHGYGVFRPGRPIRPGGPRAPQVKAHRLSFELCRGPIPAGRLIRHLCHNTSCVRPDHLADGTPMDNSQDARAAGRIAHGERIAQSKLTEAQVIEMREGRAAGLSLAWLAETYGVDPSLVSQICRGRKWVRVGGPRVQRDRRGWNHLTAAVAL